LFSHSKSSARHRIRNFKQQKYSLSDQKFKTKNSPKSKHSAVTIHPLNKAPDSLESKEDQQNKSKIFQEIEHKMNSTSINKITVVKLSKKEVSKSSHNRSNEDLKINDNTKSNEDTSIHINDQIFTHTENSNTIQRRNSILSAVKVTKIKKMTDDTKVLIDKTKSNPISSSNGNKSTNTRVTRISSKKKTIDHSTVSIE
jgi:hypothetical protein